jgi:hypothetical protein
MAETKKTARTARLIFVLFDLTFLKPTDMKYILLISFAFFLGSATAQTAMPDFNEFNKKREKISRNGMYVLGGWAVGNMAYSGVQYYRTEGTEKYFNQMNVIWNSVNLVLAGGSLLARPKSDLDFNKTMRFQMNTEKMFLANAALDLVYSSAGVYLMERAKTTPKNYYKFNGWGQSLVLQGGFLFLFDSAMYVIHTRHGKKKLYPLFDKMTISTSGLGLKIGMQL